MERTESQKNDRKPSKQTKQLILWIGALVVGAVLGMLGISALNLFCKLSVFLVLFKVRALDAYALYQLLCRKEERQ